MYYFNVGIHVQGQGEKFSVLPTTDVTLGRSGHGVGTRTGASVTATLW